MSDARLLLAHLSWHPGKRRQLVQRLGSPDALLHAIRAGRLESSEEDRAVTRANPDHLRESLEESGIAPVLGEDLPELLKQIPDPPDVLFVKGALSPAAGVAVVGSRNATGYGTQLARSFGGVLARAGVTVTSGLARGIDGAAHEAVVSASGQAIAVLGCGIDRWYPASHRRLGESIVECGGAIVSEYPPGTPPAPWRFPVRNRIISGLSEAVVVVEAAERGGALITARLAADQGRTVLAVPGDVDRPTAIGANKLIRDGALPVLGPDDLLAVVETATSVELARSPMDPLVQLIGVGRRPEWLAAETGMPVPELFVRLGELESAGQIEWRNGLVCVA